MENKDVFGTFLKDLGKGAKGIVNNVAEVGSKTMNNIETSSKLKDKRNNIERTLIELGNKIFKDGYDEKEALIILDEYKDTLNKMYKEYEEILEENKKKELEAENKDYLNDVSEQAKSIMDEINKDLERKKINRKKEKINKGINKIEEEISEYNDTLESFEERLNKLNISLEANIMAKNSLNERLKTEENESDYKDIEDIYISKEEEIQKIEEEIKSLELSIDNIKNKIKDHKEK